MEVIKFSTNWNNKLYCNAFTTFRIHNANKYKIGKVYCIQLKQPGGYKTKAQARIIAIRTCPLSDIGDFISYIDTGYPQQDFKKMVTSMYKNIVKDFSTQQWDFILLSKI